MFLRTLWSSIKEIKALFVFDGELGIALHAMQGNRASSQGKGEVLYCFSTWGRNLGYILEFHWERPFKTRVSSPTSGLLSSFEGHRWILLEAWQSNRDAS